MFEHSKDIDRSIVILSLQNFINVSLDFYIFEPTRLLTFTTIVYKTTLF